MMDWPGLADAMAISNSKDAAKSAKKELQELRKIVLLMHKELETLRGEVDSLVQWRAMCSGQTAENGVGHD